MSADPIFRVIFSQEDKIYEIYAREIDEDSMMGFICIGDLIFGELGGLVVDPSEERLKAEFQGVKNVYIPIHMLLRIDEMDKQGPGKIKETNRSDNIREFPSSTQMIIKKDKEK